MQLTPPGQAEVHKLQKVMRHQPVASCLLLTGISKEHALSMHAAMLLSCLPDLTHCKPVLKEAKVMDQTRGILTYVEQNCPGRFHASIEYVTVAGKYIQGAGLRDKGASIAQKVIGAGYQQVRRRTIPSVNWRICLFLCLTCTPK